MTTFITEKATQAADLPHGYIHIPGGKAGCTVCAKPQTAEIHAPITLETAASHIDLITEKGI